MPLSHQLRGKMKRKGLSVLVMFFSVIAWSQSGQINFKSFDAETWLTYNDDVFSISYPDSFEVNTSGMMNASLFLFSKQRGQEDLFRENVNIIVQDLSGHNIDLDQYVSISEEQIRNLVTESRIIETVRVKAFETEYHKVIFTGVQGQFDLKFVQHYYLKGSDAFILTFTCEISEFEKYEHVGNEILKSFKISK